MGGGFVRENVFLGNNGCVLRGEKLQSVLLEFTFQASCQGTQELKFLIFLFLSLYPNTQIHILKGCIIQILKVNSQNALILAWDMKVILFFPG